MPHVLYVFSDGPLVHATSQTCALMERAGERPLVCTPGTVSIRLSFTNGVGVRVCVASPTNIMYSCWVTCQEPAWLGRPELQNILGVWQLASAKQLLTQLKTSGFAMQRNGFADNLVQHATINMTGRMADDFVR